MDNIFWYALIASTISSLGGLAGGILLLAHERSARFLSKALIGFSAGVLLGVTFLDLLPEATQGFADPQTGFRLALFGVAAFFLIERILTSLHRHQDEYEQRHAESGSLVNARPLVILGDTVHNFLDGIVVAVAFVVSTPVGFATAASVLLHELPHEIADFTILLRSGMERKRVLVINLLSALVAPLGTILAFFFARSVVSLQLPLLALAAGNLLYIAMSDLLPHLHHERNTKHAAIQVVLFFIGIMIFLVFPTNE